MSWRCLNSFLSIFSQWFSMEEIFPCLFAKDIALTSLLIHIAQYGTVSPYHGFQRHQGSAASSYVTHFVSVWLCICEPGVGTGVFALPNGD